MCKNIIWIKSYNKILVKIFIFSCLRMPHFRANLPKWVLTPQKENSCHIFKLAIFSKFFVDLMGNIIRKYEGKKIEWFLNVSPLTIVNILLWPFMVFSLYIHAFSKQQTKETTSWQTFAKRPASFVCLETFFYSNEEPFEGWTKICAFRLTPSEKENHQKIDCSLKEVYRSMKDVSFCWNILSLV